MSGEHITVRFFARLREQTGCAQVQLAWPAGQATTVADVRALLVAESSVYHALNAGPVHSAVNQCLAQHDSPVVAGDEVAFFPPVTGG